MNAAYTKAAGELADLKTEIIRSIRGESAFPKDVLAELIRENETKCLQLEAASEQAKTAMVETEAITEELQRQHDDILSFADLYDSAGIEAKKMVVSAMIRLSVVRKTGHISGGIRTILLAYLFVVVMIGLANRINRIVRISALSPCNRQTIIHYIHQKDGAKG